MTLGHSPRSLCPHTCVLLHLAAVLCFAGALGCGGGGGGSTEPPPSVVSLQIQSSTSTVLLGNSVQAKAVGYFNDGSISDLTNMVTWKSSNPLVAFVGNDNGRKGFISGVGGGVVTIDATSGSITGKYNLTVSVPAPRFAYLTTFLVPSRSYVIQPFTVDPNTGALTIVPGSAVPTGGQVTLDPGGKFLYTTCSSTAFGPTDAICSYMIDRDTGALQFAEASPVLPQTPNGIVVSPTGKFLYTILVNSSRIDCAVAGFSINGTTGVLTAILSSAVVNQLSQCDKLVFDPSERFLYAKGIAGTIAGFNIDKSTGVLTPINGSPFTVPIDRGTTLTDVAVDVAGRYIYYDFDWNFGSLPIAGATGGVTSGPILNCCTRFIGSIVTHPSGRFLYSQDPFFGILYELSIDPRTGEMTPANGYSSSGGGASPTVDPSGKFLYLNGSTIPPQVLVFGIDANTGNLALISTVQVPGDYPGQLIVTP